MIRKTIMVAALASSALFFGTAQAQFFGGDNTGSGSSYGSGDTSGRGAGTGSGSGDFEMNVKARGTGNMDTRGDWAGNSNMYGGGYGAPQQRYYYPPQGYGAPYGYPGMQMPMMAPPFAPPAPPAAPAR